MAIGVAFKDIKGYEGQYGITSCGKVWSYKSKKFLSQSGVKYKHVILCKGGIKKTFLVHRLVAETYIDNPNSYETVDHIDGNTSHNWANNLQWLNLNDNIKRTQGQKIRCIETGVIYNSQREAASQNGLNQGNLQRALKNNWKCGGYHWEVLK